MVDRKGGLVPLIGTVRREWRVLVLVNGLIWALVLAGLWAAFDTLLAVWRRP